MARVTVEDCIDKVDSPYELVLVAKERATQLNSGLEATVDRDNDKNTVEQVDETSEEDEEVGDDFENLYKGEISKSGVPILPSKRARKIPEKIQVSKDDLNELQNSTDQVSQEIPSEESEEAEVSIDELKDQETANASDASDTNDQ